MFINFGLIEPLNNSEQLTFDSYAQIKSIIKNYIDKGSKLDEYGLSDKASPIWEYGNKVIYLVLYLNIINEQIQKDYDNSELQTFDYYKDLYKLDCIKKEFSCLSIPFDTDLLYEVFGLGKFFGFDGIGYMPITDGVTIEENITFQVNKTRI